MDVKQFADISYFIRAGHHARFLDALDREYAGRGVDFFSRRIFALIKPDAVLAGKARPIGAWLKENGFETVFSKVVWVPQERQFEGLYKYNLTLRNEKNQLDSWWLNRQIYSAGPSVLVVLESCREEAPLDCYSRIAAIKGASDPRRCSPGQLRYDIDASNMALNLLHCADDPVSSLRESMLFFPLDEAERAVKIRASGRHPEESAKFLQKLSWLDKAFCELSPDPVGVVLRQMIKLAIESGDLEFLAPELGAIAIAGGRVNDRMVEFGRQRSAIKSKVLSRRVPGRASAASELLTDLIDFPFLAQCDAEPLLRRVESLVGAMGALDRVVFLTTVHYCESYK